MKRTSPFGERLAKSSEMPRAMSFEPSDKYTNSALRIGDTDTYPQRLVGEFIGTVVSNAWVNEEYKHVDPEGSSARAESLRRADVPPALPLARWRRSVDAPADERVPRRPGRRPDRVSLQDRRPRHPRHGMLEPGDDFNVAGPLGHGFTLDPGWKNIVVLGRGVGLATLAPLSQLAAEHKRRRHRDPQRAQSRRRDVEGAVRGSRRARPSSWSIPTTAARSRTSRKSSRT